MFLAIFIVTILAASLTGETDSMTGWAIIGFVLLILHCNLVLMLGLAWLFVKSLYPRKVSIEEQKEHGKEIEVGKKV